jgi:multisubunit Na+/H+ antiporter MnhG subunit
MESGRNRGFIARAPGWAKAVASAVVFLGVIISLLTALGVVRQVPDVFGADGVVARNRLVAAGFTMQEITALDR